MADKRVSDLTAAETIEDADLFVMEQGGEAKSITGEKVKGLVKGKQIQKIRIAEADTMTVIDFTYTDGSSNADVITYDENGYPVNIKSNGIDIPVERVVADE